MKLKRFLLFIFYFLLFIFHSHSQIVTFQKVYGGINDDLISEVRQAFDKGYYMAGLTKSYGAGAEEVLIVKVDSTGKFVWGKAYGGGGYDVAASLLFKANGDNIIIGTTMSFGAGSSDCFLIQTNNTGDTNWTKTIGSSGADLCYDACKLQNSNYLIGGSTNSFGTNDIFVIKLDSSGNIIWAKTYGESAGETFFSIVETADENFLIAGYTGSYNAYLIKCDINGDTIWTKAYSTKSSYIDILSLTDNGFIFISGTDSFGAGISDVLCVRIDSIGNLIWAKKYGGTNIDYVYGINQNTESTFIVTGQTKSFGLNTDLFGFKINIIGDTLWTKRYGGNNTDYTGLSEQTSDGGAIILGNTNSFGINNYDFYLVKTDAFGNSGGCNEGSAPFTIMDVTDSIKVSSTATIVQNVTSLTKVSSTGTIVTNVTPDTSTLCFLVGIEENGKMMMENGKCHIFPNPTTGIFWVRLPESAKSADIMVYNILGEVILEKEKTFNPVIDLSKAPAGIYFIKAKTEGMVFVEKIVMQ